MGQSASSEGVLLQQQYQSSLTLFTSYEQGEIKQIFDTICKTPATELECSLSGFEKSQLQGYIDGKLPDSTTNRLYDLLKLLQLCGAVNKPDDVPISHHAFVVAMAMLFKGTLDQHCHLIHCLATENRNGVPAVELSKFVSGILQHYEKALQVSNRMSNWKLECSAESQEKLLKFAVHDAMSVADGDNNKVFDESEIASWLQKEPFFQTLLINIFHICFSPPAEQNAQGASASTETASSDDINISTLHEIKALPQCLDIDWAKTSTLLDLPSVLLLNQHIPHSCRGQWRYCFSSQTDGASFATMVRHISKQGPVVMIVRDTDGNVFGGFASQSWALRPNFTGSSQCFLFSLSPSYGIYGASQHNDHYMYLNTDQQTLPNGLGMGGQFDYFGLWIDQEFGTGHSKAKPKCTTYDSPQLSVKENFTIDVLEAWAVGPPAKLKDDDLYEDSQVSILDRDPEAQAILDLVGKERKSEGLRDEEPTADIPEEHNLYPSGAQDN
ncbi:MTOR-associated protein MEAK7-like [Amphiura filiformis]|uniref:MTOR-associated protein MEAK7-like n=1 Tax=Amphiura filiformis TaxID=82378 RepID=UPI003B226E35